MPQHDPSKHRSIAPGLISGLVLLAALLFVVLHRADARGFMAVVTRAQPGWLLAAIAAQALTYATEAGVWHAVLRRSGQRLSPWTLYRLSVVVLFTNQAVPSAGLAGTVAMLNAFATEAVPRSAALAAVLVDTIGYYVAFVGSVALAVAILHAHHDLHPSVLAAAATLCALGIGIAVAAAGVPRSRMPTAATRNLLKKLASHFSVFAEADAAVVRHPRLVAAATGLRALNFALDAFTLWTCLRAVGEPSAMHAAFSAFIIGAVARTLGVIPGGIGPFEAAAVGTLHLFAVPIEPAVTAVLLFRGFSFWLPLLAGMALHARQHAATTAPILPLLARQFLHPLMLLLFVAAGLSIAVGETVDGWVILSIVVLSGSVGFVQEFRAEQVLRRLLAMVHVSARVRRGDRIEAIPLESVRVGDVVLLDAGSLIPGDGTVLTTNGLQIDESLLTGESFPAEKSMEGPPSDPARQVALGTHVVSGAGEMRVDRIGRETRLGQVARRLEPSRPPTAFDRAVQRFGYLLLRVTFALILAIFAANIFLQRPALDALLFAVAIAVGLAPELLPAIVAVNLARGAHRLAGSDVIVRRLQAIEGLGAVDILCSDKTGTLTEGKVRLDAALALDGTPSARVLEYAALNASFESGYANPLDAALRLAWTGGTSGWRACGEVAYDFTRKRLSVLLERDGTRLLVTKGQFGAVLSVCSTAETAEGSTVGIEAVRARLHALHARLAEAGQRVLAVAVRPVPATTEASRELEQDLCLLGVLAFGDAPKIDAGEAMQELAQLGVTLKVLTGDDRRVAAHVWKALRGTEPQLVTGEALRRVAGHGIEALVRDADVFAEVEPQQKELVVHALRRAGHTVAFLGDGINDAPALHAADVGISVDTAADVARQAADIVLRRRDLGVLAAGIREGRRTMAKTLVYVRYTTSANFGNMLSMAIASVMLPFLPILPKQILLNNFLSDLPTLALTGDRVDDRDIQTPGRWDHREIRKFVYVFGALSSVFDLGTFAVFLTLTRGNADALRTGWFVESLLTEVLVLLSLRTRGSALRSRPGTPLVAAIAAVVACTLALPVSPLAPWFGLVPLQTPLWVAVFALTLGYVATTEFAKRWMAAR